MEFLKAMNIARMKANACQFAACLLTGAGTLLAAAAMADDSSDTVSLRNGGYLAPMGTFNQTLGNSQLGSGGGGTLAAGYRQNFYAFEGRGFYSEISAKGGPGAHLYGGTLDGLLFPFLLSSAPHPEGGLAAKLLNDTYVIAGAGAQDLKNYGGQPGSYGSTDFQAGIGDLVGFHWGRYQFALRLEALYQVGLGQQSPKNVSAGVPNNLPNHVSDVMFNIGLQLPLGMPPPPIAAPPPEPPPAVVPPGGVPSP